MSDADAGISVKDAIAIAKEYVRDVFEDENVEHVGLEGVDRDLDNGDWEITVGFNRPWDVEPDNSAVDFGALAGLKLALKPKSPRRTFTVVRVNPAGEVTRLETLRD